ncbi:MAG: DUF1836 domain-containing protein [Candidatus Scatovivens sp.]
MKLKNFNIHLPRWEELPNIDLYLDQVVTLLEEYLGDFMTNKEDKIITKTMINNYVKHGVIKPPENKKYSKSHLARLIVICILKQIYSINDIKNLIKLALDTSEIQISYNSFCIELENAINLTFNGIKTNEEIEMTKEKYILKNVAQSFVSKIYVEKTFLNKE